MVQESVLKEGVSAMSVPATSATPATAIPAAKAATVAAIPAAKAATVAALPAAKAATVAALPAAKAATIGNAVPATGIASVLKGIMLSPIFGIVALGGIIAFELWKGNMDALELKEDKKR